MITLITNYRWSWFNNENITMIDRDGLQGGGEFEGRSTHRTPELGFGRRAPAGGVNQCANPIKWPFFGDQLIKDCSGTNIVLLSELCESRKMLGRFPFCYLLTVSNLIFLSRNTIIVRWIQFSSNKLINKWVPDIMYIFVLWNVPQIFNFSVPGYFQDTLNSKFQLFGNSSILTERRRFSW